ncbi:MAG: hypothetical protein ACTHJW_16645, partial [Streptosporangiaceae bacterium]
MTWRASSAGAAWHRAAAGGWRLAAAALAVACAAGLAGCGDGIRHAPPASGVLPEHAITGLPEVTRALTAADVQKDSSLHDLAGRL